MPDPAPFTEPGKPVRLFLSHASEDKADFVEPLANALVERGFDVWFDKFVLTMGDSLLQKISEGLRECDYGIVVLSPAFFAKKWPKSELDGLFALQDAERKVILPIWKDVTEADVKTFSPILAGMLAARASEGMTHVIEMIEQAVAVGNKVAAFSPEQALKARFAKLSKDINTEKESARLLFTVEGVQVLRKAVAESLKAIESLATEISVATGLMFKPIITTDNFGESFFQLNGPFELFFTIGFDKLAINSATQATLVFTTRQVKRNEFGIEQAAVRRRAHHFKPLVLDSLVVQWNSVNEVPSLSLLTGQIPAYFMEMVAFEVEKEREAWKKRSR